MFAIFTQIAPLAFFLVGGFLFFDSLNSLLRPSVMKAEAKSGDKAAVVPMRTQILQMLTLLFAVGTVRWATQQPPDHEVLNSLTATSVWAALVCGIVLVVDDLFLEPSRRLSVAPDQVALRSPLTIEILRRLLLLFVLGTIICAVRARSLDFSLVLVVAMAVTGLLWLMDIFLLRRQRAALAARYKTPVEAAAQPPVTIEYAISFFPVILVVLVIRSFLLEPFRIPSDSMMPTLFDGDFIFVNKYAYGLRLPVVNTKIVEIDAPQRGDVIVFRLPTDPAVNYIKRLVGLPGDHVKVVANRVYINGVLLPLKLDGKYSDTHGYFEAQLAKEQLGDVNHTVMFMQDRRSTDYETEVPVGHYFFMGDNRNNSQDSRWPQVGFVPEKNLVGRAVRIWMHWRDGPNWSRIGSKIE